MGWKLEQLGGVGGVVKAEVNEGAKEMMGLAHAKMVNDGGTMDEKVTDKMEIESHVVRGSVAEAGGNKKVIIQPYWSVLPTNGRLEGENFQGALNKMVGKPFILKRKDGTREGERSQGEMDV